MSTRASISSVILFSCITVLAWSFRTPSLSHTSRGVRFSPLPTATIDSTISVDKLQWSPTGYKAWTWRGHKINYIDLGEGNALNNLPPLLLIHGFGASSYHWRYNIPALSKDYHVYAIDLLGFGLSDKPIMDYSADVWKDQTLDFIEEVIGKCTVVAGNSLGGFTALFASASDRAHSKNLIGGCILLNAAGRFRDPNAPPTNAAPSWLTPIKAFVQKTIIGFSFVYTKQPSRIAQVLRQVYPVDQRNVDDELVESIRFPAQDPNASEVFYRVIVRNGSGPEVYVDDLLEALRVPLLLLWGMKVIRCQTFFSLFLYHRLNLFRV